MIKIICILFFFSFAANAFDLSVVDVNCLGVRSCSEISKKFDDLKGNYPDEKSLKESIRFLLVDKTIKYFDYSLTVSDEAIGTLSLTISEKEIVGKIKINFDRKLKIPELEQIIPLKADTPFEDTQIEDCKVIITKFLTDKGIETESIEIIKNVKDQIANFVINVKIKNILFVRSVNINFKETNNEKWIKLKMLALKDKSYDKTQFKIILNEIKTKLQDLGYVNFNIETEEVKLTPESVQLNVNISFGHFVSFSFFGNSIINHESLRQESRKVIKNDVNIDSLNILDQSIRNLYIKKGLHSIGLKIRHEAIKKLNTEVMAHYVYVTINEGLKSKISKLEFFGNNIIPATDIEDLYYQNATELAESGFYDDQYAKDFSSILSKKYISLGYNFVSIDEPKAVCRNSDCILTYLLNEKQQSFLTNLTVTGVPKALVDKYLPDLKNKINQPTNLVELDQDLGYLLRKIKDEGYYFSSYQSLLPKEILKFNNNYSEATLNLQIENAKMTKIAGVFISGNVKTLQEVIRRELDFKIGDTLTPEIVERSLENINSTGLFSRVQVNPVIASDSNGDDILANIVINVQERDSVILETGPGYRTDLGLKAKAGASLNNLMGMNRTISLISEANYRLTFDSLDSRRRTERTRITEFDIKATYIEPYFIPQIFGKAFDWQVGLSSSRKRFYGFDADINKISNEFTKNITRKWSLSMKYQLESIEQSDATESKDQGYFRIGSVTPTLSFDLREPKVNSKKGALFSLSCEYATPSLGSKDRNDLEINYYKLISRNKFYIPIYKFVLASSVTVGQEKNLASDTLDDANNNRKTRGYIPGVKVFRLQGVDNVRGFSDNEINNVESINKDIGEILIEDTAYFVNTKIEPRYYMNDSSIIGLFFDAGRIFVNHFKPTKLRTSVGLSYKVLTPVGTLDFDYGMKIKRERNAADQEETFGRFQLAIGFF
jgi:outer membrane protein insertion porin family